MRVTWQKWCDWRPVRQGVPRQGVLRLGVLRLGVPRWGIAAACIAALVAGTPPAAAYDEAGLLAVFSPSDLTRQELRVVQGALAFTGDYKSYLDGDWGPGSAAALSDYAARTEGDPDAPAWVVVLLAAAFADILAADGWHHRAFGDMSLLVPYNIVQREPTDQSIYFDHLDSSLSFAIGFANDADTVFWHDFVLSVAAGEAPYTLRRDGLWITAVTRADGTSVYLRSDFLGLYWSQISVTAAAADAGPLSAVAGSILRGPPVPLVLPADGMLAAGLRTLDRLNAASASASPGLVAPPVAAAPAVPPPVTPPSTTPAPPSAGSGTGFVVSTAGHVLTNAHVIAGCAAVTVDGGPARVVAQDHGLDLALIETGLRSAAPAFFGQRPIGLNADVTVAGFPLQGLLSGLNVTRGSVTAERGLGGDATRMQISAPVQPGNSGGPVLAADGTVAGVVVSKLDAGYIAEVTGDIPQNVNFAIRGEMAQLFLMQNGVIPGTAADLPRLDPERLSIRAQEITRLIACL